MNFTKGPWVAVHQPDQDAEMATVCWCADWCIGVRTPGVPGGNYRDIDWGDPAADARLIAQAPDLLAALKALMHVAVEDRHEFDMIFRRAASAVAAAEGPL